MKGDFIDTLQVGDNEVRKLRYRIKRNQITKENAYMLRLP
jgi:hypothetical protein